MWEQSETPFGNFRIQSYTYIHHDDTNCLILYVRKIKLRICTIAVEQKKRNLIILWPTTKLNHDFLFLELGCWSPIYSFFYKNKFTCGNITLLHVSGTIKFNLLLMMIKNYVHLIRKIQLCLKENHEAISCKWSKFIMPTKKKNVNIFQVCT